MKQHLGSLGLLAGLWLVWSYAWSVSKLALPYIGPFDLATARTLCGVLGLGILLVATGRSLAPTPFWPTFWLGLAQTAGFTALSNFALVTGGAGKVSVLAYTMPFWTLVLARVFLDERLSKAQWASVALAFAGLMAIVEPWHLDLARLSEWLAVAAGLTWASSAIIAKTLRRHRRVDVMSLTFWQMFWGFWPLLAVSLAMGEPAPVWGWELAAALLYLGPLANSLGWLIWMVLLGRLSAGATGLGALVVPALSVAIAALQFGEIPSLSESLGMALIALSLGLLCVVTLGRSKAG
ncbi:DMT family transporter [Crenobacter cavernae]|uniref:DMT family transporter n=1 Tax=Crenobacter cavernae TaxID=2290923 RepID=A0A345Y2D1_9NEIS|nr:DMT family transporter [Crenobacter cavernae]AXK38083.1 DMT family transporter [Crenobacter cavernae]